MEEHIVIGIEGMVASGKTSICKELINLIPNSIFIDAGEIYRGIIEAVKKNNIDLTKAIGNSNPMDLMKKLNVEFKIENKMTQIYINGSKISNSEIETVENSIGVSKMAAVSNNSQLYDFARKIIDTYRQKFNIILSARDLVTIYPDMTHHIYITANLEERVKRKMIQYGKNADYNVIKENITKRDELQEKSGYYKIYDNTIKIDVTNCTTIEESTKEVLKHIKY